MRTHMSFDSLAAAIRAGAPRDTVVGRIAYLTSTCIACHASYQIAVDD